ncbi:DsbE family thiol:disulfide interchange protein [Paraferrimonas sp. SM1919]|uniref:DsbE family thiol:disulfide interchange protein n=1 Tax=Paraferrimonas sp. SM1919 TaxID=2662263 RepID=UPI0013D46B77|nr:DsbE family thiol:disulfide interchange protein [Paraferrimonas sp. SM1919]
MKKALLFLPLLVFVALAGFLFRGLYLKPAELESALINKPVPSFSLTSLHQSDVVVTEKDLIGEVALLNVWGTWCPACKFEHPFLMKLAEQNVLPIHGINYRDNRDAAVLELKHEGNPYKLNIFDSHGRLGLDLGVYGAPETFLIDAKGIVRYRFAGPIDQKIWLEEFLPRIEKIKAEG